MSYELQPKRVEEFGFGGFGRVVGDNPSLNECLRRAGANIDVVEVKIHPGIEYIWTYEVCGSTVYTTSPNKIARLGYDGGNIKSYK